MRKLLLELMTFRGMNKKYNESLFSPRERLCGPNGKISLVNSSGRPFPQPGNSAVLLEILKF